MRNKENHRSALMSEPFPENPEYMQGGGGMQKAEGPPVWAHGQHKPRVR